MQAGILTGALYLASYLMLLKPEAHCGVCSLSIMECYRTPSYRLGGATYASYFAPLQWIDQRIRPNYWNWRIQLQPVDLNTPFTVIPHDEQEAVPRRGGHNPAPSVYCKVLSVFRRLARQSRD
jgi:hypothetical protein